MENNVVLITIDCLRADHLSCYGHKRETTPFIDSLANEGIRYENAYANGPFTSASFLSILASAYPLDFEKMLPVSKNIPLLSKLLKKIKIRTAAVHSNPYLSTYYGYNQGWDYFEDFIHTKSRPKRRKRSSLKRDVKDLIKQLIPKKLRIIIKLFSGFHGPYENAEIITDNAINWLKKNKDSPFFLWLHYMDLHEPYFILNTNINRKYSKDLSFLSQIRVLDKNKKNINVIENVVNIYDDKLNYIDNNLERLFNFLKKENKLENTFLILTSDHGQEFFEHGNFGHAARFYNEILHIPLVLYGPSIEKNVNGDLVSQLDIAPTILHFFNLQAPREYQGHNLLSRGEYKNDFIISETLHNEKGVYIHNNEIFPGSFRTYALQTKEWKYIHKTKENNLYDFELYNLINDPREQKNLAHKETEKLKEFQSKVEAHILDQRKSKSTEREKLNKKINELRNLGKL
jgi:arylsulfatase A-like enzyme